MGHGGACGASGWACACKASREPPREGWRWAGDWRRSGGLSSLAVAAVSRDTMRSFSPPAATPVTVSRYARLSLATGGSHGRGSLRWRGGARARVQGICCVQGVFPPREHDGGELRKRLLHAVGPLDRPKLANPRPAVAPEAGRRPVHNGPNGLTVPDGQSRGVEGARTKPGEHPGR